MHSVAPGSSFRISVRRCLSAFLSSLLVSWSRYVSISFMDYRVRRYPAIRNERRRAVLEIVTFVHIHFFASPHQITVEVMVVTTKASQTIKPVWKPLYSGIALIIQASPIIIRSEEINSVTRSFHIPFIASFISASLNFLSPWWIFIHIFPKRGPCHTAPRAKLITVERMIIVQLSPCIEKKVRNKPSQYTWNFCFTRIGHFLFFYFECYYHSISPRILYLYTSRWRKFPRVAVSRKIMSYRFIEG